MRFETLFEGIGAGPVIACGAALGILIGVAGGESIDTTPLQRGETLDRLVSDRYASASDAGWVDAGANMPDRYPQETRAGRVEVWELRSYILRRERRPEFAYLDGGADNHAKLASSGEALPAPENHTPAPLGYHPQVKVDMVPGRLEQAVLPVGDEAVLETATAHVARADAISAELKRGAMAWEAGARKGISDRD